MKHVHSIGAWATSVLLVLTGTGCRLAMEPAQKLFDAVGGKEALVELEAFGYESAGERFEPEQGQDPSHVDIKASEFSLSVLYDVRNDRLSLDWRREILNPPHATLAYKDVLHEDVGYQTGNDFVFNPQGARSDRALSSFRIGALRREFRLLNPQLYLRALAMDEAAGTVKPDVDVDGRPHHVIEMSDVVPVELFVDAASGRLSKLRTYQADPLWGDVLAEATYGEWSSKTAGSVSFPHRVELAISGNVIHRATRLDVVANPTLKADDFPLPSEPRTVVDARALERGAMMAPYVTRWNAIGLPFGDEEQTHVVATPVGGDAAVQYLTGGSHHSLAVKLEDGIVLIEAPMTEARSVAVLDKLEELWPGAPVSHVVLTHHHFDHIGGVRTYAAQGARIVTSAMNGADIERALRASHALIPDRLARTKRVAWSIETVPTAGEFRLEADGRRLHVRHVGSIHARDNLVVYLPENRLLFESDIYVMPGGFPPNRPLPSPFSGWARELRDGLTPFGWNIEWIAGGHGTIAPFTDLASHFDS